MRVSICAACSGFSITSDSVISSLSVAQQLARRNIDAGEDRLARAAGGLPDRELARGAFEHEQAEVDDQADFLGGGDELGRRQPAELGVIPARQRLEAGNGGILQ